MTPPQEAIAINDIGQRQHGGDRIVTRTPTETVAMYERVMDRAGEWTPAPKQQDEEAA